MEIDGDSHAEQEAYDKARTAALKSLGYGVLRVANRDVLHNLSGVLEVILNECRRRNGAPSP